MANWPVHGALAGAMTLSVTVWCGECATFHETMEWKRREAGKVIRQRGWILTRDHGWLCPDCAKKYKQSKTRDDESPLSGLSPEFRILHDRLMKD